MHALRSLIITTIFLLCSTLTQAATIVETLEGNDVDLASLKGKWVFINYWASWCGPCLDEIAELNHFYADNKDGKVAVFAVNYDSLSIREQQRLVRKFDIQYPSLKHNTARVLSLGPISVVPVTFVLNPDGNLSTTLYGGQTIDSLNDATG